MNILFTICGRAGSKGFKNKNLKEMREVPLIFYSLAAIKGYIDKYPSDCVSVALNTDSEPLIELVLKQNIVPVKLIKRKSELAGDAVAKVEVIKDTFLSCLEFNPDVIIDLDITSPMRRVEDIESIVNEYKKNVYDVVFSVVEARRSPYFNMVEKKSDGFYRKICESQYTARQQSPKGYELNASIYAYSPRFLAGEIIKTILEYNCGISIMPDYLVLDIDSEEDFQMMQILHCYYCKEDKKLDEVYAIATKMTQSI